jgi:hypothetical protein
VAARAAKDEAYFEETRKAFDEMQAQWLQDRAAGKPLTKYDVQIGRRVMTWPPENSIDDWHEKLDCKLAELGKRQTD